MGPALSTLLFRGEALTPEGLSQMAALVDEIVSDSGVGELLASGDPIVAPASLIKALLQVDGFESVTQAEIDSARGAPEIQEGARRDHWNRHGRHTGRDRHHPSPRHGRRAS